MALYRFHGFVLDETSGKLTRDGATIRLQPLPWQLLHFLVRHPNVLFSRAELDARLWPDARVTEDSLSQAVRKLRRALGAEAGRLQTVPRRGYLLDAVVEEVVDEPAVRSVRTAPETRPPDPAEDLVGRDAERAALRAALARGERLITLVGPGGVGKTRLAAALRADDAGRTSWWVELGACEGEDDVLRRVAAALGEVRLGGGAPVARLGLALAASGPSLLVLDEVERVAEVAGRCVAAWLEEAPELAVLATGRVALGLARERRVEVAELPAEAATRLLLRRAPLLDPDDPELPALVAATEGLPLAIELLAPRTRLMPTATLRALLEADRLRVLADPCAPGDRPVHHRSLRAAVLRSLSPLPDQDRRGLLELSAFEAPIPFGAADALLGDGTPGGGLDALQRLVDASLVRTGSTGLWLSAPVRQLVQEQATDDERTAARHRHATLVAGSEDAHDDDLVAALRWALRTGDLDLVLRLAPRVDARLVRTGPPHQRLALAEQALELVEVAGHPNLPRLRAAHADALRHVGRSDRALAELERAERESSDAGHRDRVALVRAATLSELGQHQASVVLLSELRSRADAVDDPTWAARCDLALGLTHLRADRGEEADRALRRALAAFRVAGDAVHVGRTLGNLGFVAHARGRFEEAHALALEALGAYRLAGDALGALHATVNLADAALRLGRLAEAERWLAEGLRTATVSEPTTEVAIRRIQADLWWAEGRHGEALVASRRGYRLARRCSDAYQLVRSAIAHGTLLDRLSVHQEAEELADDWLGGRPRATSDPSLGGESLDEADVPLRIVRASARLRRGELAGAGDDLDRVRAAPVDVPWLALSRARSRVVWGLTRGAGPAWAEADRSAAEGELTAGDVSGLRCLVRCAEGSWDEAVGLAEAAAAEGTREERAAWSAVRCVAMAELGRLGPGVVEGCVDGLTAAPPAPWPLARLIGEAARPEVRPLQAALAEAARALADAVARAEGASSR